MDDKTASTFDAYHILEFYTMVSNAVRRIILAEMLTTLPRIRVPYYSYGNASITMYSL